MDVESADNERNEMWLVGWLVVVDEDDDDIEQFVTRMMVQPPPPFTDDFTDESYTHHDVIVTSADVSRVTSNHGVVDGSSSVSYRRAACIDKTSCTTAAVYDNMPPAWRHQRRPSHLPPLPPPSPSPAAAAAAPPPAGGGGELVSDGHEMVSSDLSTTHDSAVLTTSDNQRQHAVRWYDNPLCDTCVNDALSRLVVCPTTTLCRPTSLQHE